MCRFEFFLPLSPFFSFSLSLFVAISVVDSKTKADCVLKMSDENCYDIMTGKLNAQTAFMGGKLKVFFLFFSSSSSSSSSSPPSPSFVLSFFSLGSTCPFARKIAFLMCSFFVLISARALNPFFSSPYLSLSFFLSFFLLSLLRT